MPILLDTMDSGTIPGLLGYGFSGVATGRLGARGVNDYTLVTIALDVSGSVSSFRNLLIETVRKAVAACRKSPRAETLMLRVVTFGSAVTEIHGFKLLDEIDDSIYDSIKVGGGTTLYDACASSIGATTEYARKLIAQDYGVNGILFIITDGDDNNSTYTARTVKEKADEALSGEVLESIITVLLGVNAAQFASYLSKFQVEAGITQYLDAGNATPGNLAKLAAFISRSVSSQANQLGASATAAPVSLVI